MTDTYITLRDRHAAANAALKKRYHLISNFRGAMALAFAIVLYQYIGNGGSLLAVLLVAMVIGFIILMRIHDRIARSMAHGEMLVRINEEEVAFLTDRALPFADGSEFIDPAHPYSHDLDIFGGNSLFQHLNRTGTHMGSHSFARSLLSLLPNDRIPHHQKAVSELAEKIGFRQDLLALARLANDSREAYEILLQWSQAKPGGLPPAVHILSLITPVLLAGLVIAYGIAGDIQFLNWAGYLFLFNLLFFSTQVKRIKAEMAGSDRMHRTIRHYSTITGRIESEEFRSGLLNELKQGLMDGMGTASTHAKRLSRLFANMDSMHSGIGAILFNGVMLLHVHNLRALLKWKKQHAAHIRTWLDVIASFEALNSLANHAFNEPDATYPELNDRYEISMKDAGHPLIPVAKRVTNDVGFGASRFVILSGSNMSGKSTFLRTLGVNMVLAGTGAPVCATRASIHPLNVLVSMRSSDSLSEGESYFFAEVKRLRAIMDRLEKGVCFVLLDEILRGTNSDDKRSGTIEVIRKIMAKGAMGVIATHDLEVCATTEEFPGQLVNKCFEVEVVNDDLHFDYKLRNGVSQNKSATFLMKKMEII